MLEARFPVVLESFEIRRESGGKGRWNGGDGGTRRIRFLQEMRASILSNGRSIAAFGMAGGSPGSLGRSIVQRADGRVEILSHIASVTMQPGDVFAIDTPRRRRLRPPLITTGDNRCDFCRIEKVVPRLLTIEIALQ